MRKRPNATSSRYLKLSLRQNLTPSVPETLFQHEVEKFRRDNAITVQGNDVPKPVLTFEESNFPGKN